MKEKELNRIILSVYNTFQKHAKGLKKKEGKIYYHPLEKKAQSN